MQQDAAHATRNRTATVDPPPDSWIDEYHAGFEPIFEHREVSRAIVSATLDEYSGKALECFQWIDLFHSLVHRSAQSPGEKLAILKKSLKGDALDVVYGLGGGEDAYKEALKRLKEAFGRRDVMRAAHLQAVDRLDYRKNDALSFKKFAERVRSHLFDLHRIGGGCEADVRRFV